MYFRENDCTLLLKMVDLEAPKTLTFGIGLFSSRLEA